MRFFLYQYMHRNYWILYGYYFYICIRNECVDYVLLLLVIKVIGASINLLLIVLIQNG